jgi:ribonuclease-3
VSNFATIKSSMMPAPLEDFEARIGYRFQCRELLQRALTHKSLPNETLPSAEAPEHNEPFEFLGDSILGYLASDYLFRHCPGAPEGRLSRLKNHLVSSAHLYEVAVSLGLGEFLRLGKGEELSGGRKKPTLMANGVEAVIAALYLDGGIEAARQFVEGEVLKPDSIEDIEAAATPLNAKSALLELAHSRKLPLPRYVIVQESGPQHAKLYTVEARLGAEAQGLGEGSTLKQASQRAAQRALDMLRPEPSEEPRPGVESEGAGS